MDNSNENKNFERSFSSSDSGDDIRTPKQSPVAASKFHNPAVTDSDIINQNLTADNELNCSSIDTIKVKLISIAKSHEFYSFIFISLVVTDDN